MSEFTPGPSGPYGQPAQQPVQSRPVLASYRTYEEAQRAVDFLSDRKFAVENLGIVGNDLKIAETVLGRLTYGRSAAGGLATGAWFGLFVGLLVGLFSASDSSWVAIMLAGLVYGAVFGTLFGLVAFALTGGRRDFTSRRQIIASTYDVVCSWAKLEEARGILAQMPAA
ncbi:MAG: general stress protein [Nocardioidaceae bacterium]